jgi:amyloid beta A4 precursor protein-binding family B protein 1-interacting protein
MLKLASSLFSKGIKSHGGSVAAIICCILNSLTIDSPQQDAASRAKAEKIRIALEKMKEASVKKLFIKAFSADGSTKSLLVDEKMTCAYVTRLLADKNHVHMDPKWGIVEHLPDLYMGKS